MALGSRAARQKGMINMKVFTIDCSGVDYANALNNLLKKCERVALGSWLMPLLQSVRGLERMAGKSSELASFEELVARGFQESDALC